MGCVVCIGLILLTTYFQYNATYFATYTESGVRRITLAERLRKIPLSFFGKKDLADLTSTIMADCTFLEQSFSHFIPELAGSIISTVLISISLLVFDWRMALAALWVLPVAFAIVGFSAKVQERLNQKAMDVKMACADGIQECIETVRDLKANNAEAEYLEGLEKKIRAVEHRSILNEFGLAAFVVSASTHIKAGNCHRCIGRLYPADRRQPRCPDLLHVPAGCFTALRPAARGVAKSGGGYQHPHQYRPHE